MNELFVNKPPFFGMIEKKEVLFMEELLEWMEYIEDVRQTGWSILKMFVKQVKFGIN